ncbi:lysozyme family protein [Methylococcus mesophilus]|uniref:hypothetical protein n=1 Tax=Methylococcus mesophilus TaxID=2993564 RepID=UPI00224B56DE|nr:hypothetical protein [Methylococcus mesophilus]UZR28571.1 hypothetical protein OOT43_17920 [Methylococcus mesophilus]
MPVLDLSPPIEERVLCSIAAAEKYGLPAHLVLAVAEQEGGKPGLWVRNANGTYDVGPMQFNTAYLAGLARYGITAAAVAQPRLLRLRPRHLAAERPPHTRQRRPLDPSSPLPFPQPPA